MSTATLFDLNKTAITAALGAVGADAYTSEEDKLAAFNTAGHDHRDYAQWQAFFNQHTSEFNTQRTVAAPSASADAHAAAAIKPA